MGGNTIFRDIKDAIKAGQTRDFRALPVPKFSDGAIYYLWVDDTGDLRVDDAFPAAHDSGTVVGTQS